MILLDTLVVPLAQVVVPIHKLLPHCSGKESDIEGRNKCIPGKGLGPPCPGLRLPPLVSLCSQLKSFQSNHVLITGDSHGGQVLLDLPDPLLSLQRCTLPCEDRRV